MIATSIHTLLKAVRPIYPPPSKSPTFFEHFVYEYDCYLNCYEDSKFVPFMISKVRLHTYIHNWPLQPFSQDYGLGSHIAYGVCVNFMREWRDLQFNVVYSQSFWEKSAEKKSPKKYFFFQIWFWCLIWDKTPGFMSNKLTHYFFF